jgi:3-oxoacyl-[acyl-carrier protein] reductase
VTLIELSGKAALVTGGSRGIGAATARLLAKAGARVVITYHSRKEEAEQIASAINSSAQRPAPSAHIIQADFSKPEAGEHAVTQAYEAFGTLDILVCNAGIWPVKDVSLAEMSPEQWRRTLAVNLDSVYYACRAALGIMMGRGASGVGRRESGDWGRIVIVSSTAGQRGEAFHADYAASKGAIISLVKSLCVEAGPYGITVNSVAPGWVDTEMSAEPYEREGGKGRRKIEEGIPLGRVASAEDIAGPIVFLCSELAGHITGEILNVNGGSVLVG